MINSFEKPKPERKGLTEEDFSFLNSGEFGRESLQRKRDILDNLILDNLRRKYRDNSIALCQRKGCLTRGSALNL